MNEPNRLRTKTEFMQREALSEPGADRGPRRGSRAGVVVATGSPWRTRCCHFPVGLLFTVDLVATAPGSDMTKSELYALAAFSFR